MSTAADIFSEAEEKRRSEEMSELEAIRAELVRIRELPLEEQPAAFDQVRARLEQRLNAEPPSGAN